MGFSEKGIPFSLSQLRPSMYKSTPSGKPCATLGRSLNILHLFFLSLRRDAKSADPRAEPKAESKNLPKKTLSIIQTKYVIPRRSRGISLTRWIFRFVQNDIFLTLLYF